MFYSGGQNQDYGPVWSPQSKILVTQGKVRAQSGPLTSGVCEAKWPPVYILKYVLISIVKCNATLSTKITNAQFQPVSSENDALPVDNLHVRLNFNQTQQLKRTYQNQ
jgi:hypothetical protein